MRDILGSPSSLFALALPRSRMGELLAGLFPALEAGGEVFCLDGGNVFDPLKLALRARRQGADPEAILRRVFVSRAYTCHQLAEAAEALLGPLAERPRPPLILLLGVERMFLDEDIPLFERRCLFARILQQAARLSAGGMAVLITCGADAGPWRMEVGKAARFLAGPREACRALGGGEAKGTKRTEGREGRERILNDQCSMLNFD